MGPPGGGSGRVPDVAAARRRGRPYKLPDDPTALTARMPGINERLAWLLGASRIHAHDQRLTRRDTFLEELRSHGLTVDTSRLSRWESGRVSVPSAVLGAYERILGLPQGQFVVAAAGVIRPAESTPARAESLDGDLAGVHQRLDRLFEQTLGQQAHGATWLELCEQLTRQRQLYLLPGTWAEVTELLADELSRSAGLAYLSRFEALRMLVRHSSSRRHAVKAIGSLVTNPAVEFVIHPLSLLQEVDDPPATDLLLRLLDDAPGHLRAGASWALGCKVGHDHVAGEDLERLERATVAILLRSRKALHRLDALGIHAHLPDESHARLTGVRMDGESRTSLELSRRNGELFPPDLARTLSGKIADKVQAETPTYHALEPDQMLARLVRECLFHVQHERRHQAALLLTASPYREPLADHLLRLVARSDENTAVLAMTAMFQLAMPRHRDALMTMGTTDSRIGVRVVSLMALGQVVGHLSDAESDLLLDRLSTEPTIARAAGYVLGMGGASARAKGHPEVPFETTSWWATRMPIVEHMARS